MEILLSTQVELFLDNKWCMVHHVGYSLHRILQTVIASNSSHQDART